MHFFKASVQLFGIATAMNLGLATSSNNSTKTTNLRGGRDLAFTQVSPDDVMLFDITDCLHHKSIVAGDVYDNHVYHQDANNRNNALWFFYRVPNHPDYYYMVDAKHRKGVVAGIEYDNNVYHQDVWERDVAMWKVEAVSHQDGIYTFTDMKHQRSIVAGDVYDGHVYHQYIDNRLNGHWKVTPLWNKNKPGPAFFIWDEQVLAIDYLTGATVQTKPVIFREEVYVNEDYKTSNQYTAEFLRTMTTTETVTTSTTTSAKLGAKIAYTIGQKGVVNWQVEASVYGEWEQSETNQNQYSRQKTSTLSSSSTFEVPPRTRCVANFFLQSTTKDIPWTATVETTFADDHKETSQVSGTWRATQFVNEHTTFTCTPIDIPMDKPFRIVNALTNKVFEVKGTDCADDTDIVLSDLMQTHNQIFKHGANGGIINVACNKALDIRGGNCDDYTNVILNPINGADGMSSQTFDIDQRSILSKSCNKALGVNSVVDESNIQLYTEDGEEWNQQWLIQYII